MEQFERTIQLIGREAFQRLQQARVILFGVGGVGGWCAEALVRTGIQHLTIVDFDTVNSTNLNRQIVATAANIGLPKVEQMRQRLLSINPQADITAINQRFTADTAVDFRLLTFDYIIDAIDSVEDKVELIYHSTSLPDSPTPRFPDSPTHQLPNSPTLFSSMGAGRKTDTEQIRIAEFWKVNGCPLARALRTRMKKTGLLPPKKFLCVWSPEISSDSGTVAPIVGVFGMKLANLVINHIIQSKQ